ncbi:uroporphyrinogen-III synthase [Methanoplanus endosymbiosus]|uniref:Uroporphyrinogen-III synthase n=1 Tax=Methanoplanus endosymbiosus TaxID=33865 RepID=A0A9E7THW0_9EURY|nr:uroporphyrinogen-III synthase [Methanoplanus endosymbiosus]UUX93717.1 uroporphyrinogen-III synthase [Methanoplanus endosymbiosus]
MRIAVTRLKEKAGKDRETCKEYGHSCYTVSPLKSEIYHDSADIFIEKANDGNYDCIFFTSALPAEIIAPRLSVSARVVAIGPQTAATLEKYGIKTEILPAFYSRDFAPYLGEWLKGKNIGIPRADVPNPVLISSVEDAGGIVDEIPVYALEATGERLNLDDADAVLFTSANSFSLAVWDKDTEIIKIAIGDITAGRMRDAGIIPDVTGDGSLKGTLREINRYTDNLKRD